MGTTVIATTNTEREVKGQARARREGTRGDIRDPIDIMSATATTIALPRSVTEGITAFKILKVTTLKRNAMVMASMAGNESAEEVVGDLREGRAFGPCFD